MSNREYLKDKDLYNNELKIRYLDTLEEKTAVVLKYIFLKSNELEYKYQTDLSNFNFNQFEEFLIILNRRSLSSLNTALSAIRGYIDFAIQEGYVNRFINIADTFNSESLEKYVNKIASKYKYIDEEIFNDIVDNLINPQDQAIFVLLWEGVKGTGNAELINLKKSDVDVKNNMLHLTDSDGSIREKKVSDKTIEILEDAMMPDQEYAKNNGEAMSSRSPIVLIADTEYVLRPAGKTRTGKVSFQNINSRFKKAAKWYGNPYLTPTSILESGMINLGKKLKEEKGLTELTKEDYKYLNKTCGLSEKSWNQTKQKIGGLI